MVFSEPKSEQDSEKVNGILNKTLTILNKTLTTVFQLLFPIVSIHIFALGIWNTADSGGFFPSYFEPAGRGELLREEQSGMEDADYKFKKKFLDNEKL